MSVRKNVKKFLSDKFRFLVSSISLVLSIFYLWEFLASSCHDINCLVRLVFFFLVAPSTIIFGKKAVYVMLILFSLGVSYLNPYNNFTGFFCMLMSCRILHHNKNILIAVYCINQFLAMSIQNCCVAKFAIHFFSCAFWYLLYFYVSSQKIVMDLTKNEEKILLELSDGKMQKEIRGFNKNTITKSLKNARKKNGCKSTNELLFKFRKSLEDDKFKGK